MSNDCRYDCAYCINRTSNNIERTTLTVDELVKITINFYRRNYIEGLFLSSCIYSTPEQTMSDMVAVAETLRSKYMFNGYIHLKVIPGTSQELIHKAGLIADRLSVNIELPSEKSLTCLAPQKTKSSILSPMTYIGDGYRFYKSERKKKKKKAPAFTPAGQSTQMIIGATSETDHQILKLSEYMYNHHTLKRVYYSGYLPVNQDSRLPAIRTEPPLKREHRLYQADWLFRYYDFTIDELLTPEHPDLELQIDPKATWALRNFDLFPIDINKAPYEMLLRVPGIGVKSAKKIIRTRSVTAIREEDLRKIGMVLKRAKYFISINGLYVGDIRLPHQHIKYALANSEQPLILSDSSQFYQPSLFEFSQLPALP